MSNFLVDSDKKLQNLSLILQSSNEIGLDTEFIRESTYRPVLALIQISIEDGSIFLIDPLKIQEKEVLADILINPKILKIIHSAKQDIEALYSYTSLYPKNIFDTQIAANFFYEQSNASYSTLVKEICDTEIKSGSWRTDWLKRPLDEDKMKYAADDVKYLIEIKNILIKKLESLGRDQWFSEELSNELCKRNIILNPETAWEKINYPLYFEKPDLDILKEIACWREKLAINHNIPKRWLLSDNQIIKAIVSNEKKANEVISNMKHDIGKSEITLLLDILKKKRAVKNKNLVPNKEIETKCTNLLTSVSEQYHIDPTIIANRRDIETFCLLKKNTKFMKGWRYEIFGKLVQ